jgi:predicted KAP-like P-loop ATPase
VNDAPRLSDDRPISRKADDRLGRVGFAEGLAKAIASWHGHESLVIALFGQWGSGKSSIKNIALEHLKGVSPEKATVRVVEFNPWQVANRDQLASAFFDQVGIAVGKLSVEKRRRLAARWQRYALYLQRGRDLASILREPVALGLALIAFGVLGFGLSGSRNVAVLVSLGLIVLAAALRWWARFAEIVQGVLAIGLDAGRMSALEMKEELASDLRGLPHPLLVVIDDIDRLTPGEALEMLQLVKANADFPNVVYLLLYDRVVLESALSSATKASGRDYLEKVVQVGFDVPSVEKGRLQKVLFEGLDQILADAEVQKHFDARRWGNMFLGGIEPFFSDLRRVNRFLSTLSFHVGAFRSQAAFEVNPIDLIALEALRVFEPKVYEALPAAKAALTERRDQHRHDEQQRTLTALVDSAQEQNRDFVKSILKQLFPSAEWAWGGSNYGHDWDDIWFRELRVCSEDVFDRYFVLGTPAGDISQTDLSSLLASTGDRVALGVKLEELHGRGLLGVALDRLEAYKERIDPAHAEPFVTALFDQSERIGADYQGMFVMSPQLHAWRIIYFYLRLPAFDEARRAAVLKAAFEATEGLSLPAEVIGTEEHWHEDAQQQDKRLVDAPSLTELKALCVERIEQSANAGMLLETVHPLNTLVLWEKWGPAGRMRAYCAGMLATQESVLKFLRLFVHRSTSHTIGEHAGQVKWYMRASELEVFIDIDAMRVATEAIDVATLSEQDARAVTTFRKALQLRAQGRDDRNPFLWHDDD